MLFSKKLFLVTIGTLFFTRLLFERYKIHEKILKNYYSIILFTARMMYIWCGSFSGHFAASPSDVVSNRTGDNALYFPSIDSKNKVFFVFLSCLFMIFVWVLVRELAFKNKKEHIVHKSFFLNFLLRIPYF